jgi:hypothetical protein
VQFPSPPGYGSARGYLATAAGADDRFNAGWPAYEQALKSAGMKRRWGGKKLAVICLMCPHEKSDGADHWRPETLE